MFGQFDCQQPQTPQQGRKNEFFSAEKEMNKTYSKKKVGQYAYYLNDLIGSGYSSHVYKGHHQNDPSTVYAIKVIKLSKLAKATLTLLQNQIKILQSLQHPNIIKFHNHYFTQNNCYLVTDYCEAGTLQDQIDRNRYLDYEDIYEQLVSGCKYLESKLIVHRDIKPANVFLKGGLWKIGDFGFARFVEAEDVAVKEMYKVGSPLYMPPQTLKSSIYSLKTDSFALGILLFYVIARRFPWTGSSDKELLESYGKNKFPSHYLSTIPFKMRRNIQGLCHLDIKERILIKDIQVEVKNLNPESEEKKYRITKMSSLETSIPEQSESSQGADEQNSNMLIVQKIKDKLDLDIIQRIKICKFINYLITNMQDLPNLQPLKTNLQRLLKLFVILFDWTQTDTYFKYLQEFNCASTQEYERVSEIYQLQDRITEGIKMLNDEKEDKRAMMVRLKLIQLSYILKLVLGLRITKMKEFLNKCILHPDFGKIYILQNQIEEIEKLFSR